MAQENDLVLIYFEDNPLSFARIESILPDAKPNWYHVTFLLLQVPVQVATWILRDAYINGEEFTMNGKRIRLERVVAPETPEGDDESGKPSEETASPQNGKVISFTELKKG